MSSWGNILQWIGIVIGIVLILAAVLIVLVLFAPIRYCGQFRIEDPVPRDEADWARLKERSSCNLTCSYLGPLVKARLSWSGDLLMDLRIAWIRIDLMALLGEHKENPRHEDTDTEEEGQKTGIYDKIVGIYRKADYYKRVLAKEETGYTISKIWQIVRGAIARILPRQWQVMGTVGLGDPAATARILEIEGMLFPIVAGHLEITPVFMQYQMDLRGSMRGHIRLIHLLRAFLSIVIDRKVRQTMRRIRSADRNIAAHYGSADQAATTT